jgi:superfamily II DNA or RNA helicase
MTIFRDKKINITGRDAIEEYSPNLRAWQQDAMGIWKRTYSGTISVVTGGGKTIFCFVCMREAILQYPDIRYLIIVPSIALLDQWTIGFQRDLGLQEDDITCFSGGASSQEPKLVNICVINTARTISQKITDRGHWFLCVDECHRSGSPANARALQGNFVVTLGLSATPQRQYDSGFEQFVQPILGPVIFEYSFEAARKDEVVAPFRLENYRIPFTLTEQKQYNLATRAIVRELRYLKENGIQNSTKLDNLLQKRSRIVTGARWRVPAAVILALKYKKPTIIFHERILDADRIAKAVQARGRRALSYHSGLSKVLRQRNLAMFRSGIIDTLVTCRSLDEGLNVPEAEIGILAASSKSIRQRVQRLGRVLRRSPGKDVAIVCTLYVTDSEAQLLRQESAALSEIAHTDWYEMRIKNG